MADRKNFYVTTPIYYVNARPHIGHAYTTIVADVLARRHRLQGDRVWFLTGTDEHGQKIERSAAAAGVAPQQFADEVSAAFSGLWKRMGITNDQYIRTTSAEHQRGVQKLFTELYDRGQIYLSSYTGQYSVGEEMFIEGPPGTIGPDGKPTETVTEENFFFRLSEYQLPLLNLIESGAMQITPEARKNEVLSFLRGNIGQKDSGAPGLASETWDGALPTTAAGTPYLPGALKDLSVSRSSFTWGIPVPAEIQQKAGAKDKHIIYVWLDALANYITALGYGSEDESKLRDFWPADVQLVGKEIIRFHCVYWPAFLMAAGLETPKAITAHGWLLFEDSKMSKSKGNIVRTETILDAFGTLCPAPPATPEPTQQSVILSEQGESKDPEGAGPATTASKLSAPAQLEPTPEQRDLFAADVLRYFLLREIPFGQDGSFTFDALITRYNADLANGYGNLVSRTLKMIQQNSDGVVQGSADRLAYSSNKAWLQSGLAVGVDDAFSSVSDVFRAVTGLIPQPGIAVPPEGALKLIGAIATRVGVVDSYLSSNAPWKLAKSESPEDRGKLIEVLYTAAENIRIITALLYPILPFATASVWRQLGLGDIEAAAARGELNHLEWGGLKPGTRLGALAPIFPRADKKLAETMQAMEQDKNTPTGANAAHDTVTPEKTEFVETAIASAGAGKKPLSKLVDETTGITGSKPTETFDPAAGPRTGALAEPNPGAQVAGSNAVTTERPGTPSHAEAEPSGIFAGSPAAAADTSSGPADASPQITIDDFAKVELRVAKVLVCERIPKADKLLRLEVDLGYEKRQILSGIAEWYTPEDLIGRRIVVITNLAPRKMRGLESHGMLLAASAPAVEGEKPGKPALATFLDSDDLPLGARLK